MDCKKVVTALMIPAMTAGLSGLGTVEVPVYAAQKQAVLNETKTVKESIDQWMPDKNLQKAIAEAMGILLEQLTPEKLSNFEGETTWNQLQFHDLKLKDKGIVSLKGLEYASKITKIDLSDNKIQDIAPLFLNKKHDYQEINLDHNRITDISAIRGVSAQQIKIMGQEIDLPAITIFGPEYRYIQKSNIKSDAGNIINLKVYGNPASDYEEKEGEIVWEISHEPAVRDKELCTFWNQFSKNSQSKSIKFSGMIHQPFTIKESPSVKQTFDLYGIGTTEGKDVHFAQLEYTGEDDAVLHGLEDYRCQIHPYFKGSYAYIKVRSKEGEVLFFKEYKGTDWTQKHDTKIPMPEGASISIYHAEPSRLQTSDEKGLKQNVLKNTYTYEIKNHHLVSKKSEDQQFQFLGLGDYQFAQMDVVDGQAWMETKDAPYGAHCYFKDQVYASVIVKDEEGKVISKKEYRGQQKKENALEDIVLKEGDTVSIYHAEPSRLHTNDDKELKKHRKENTYTYLFQNNRLTVVCRRD